MHVQLELLFGKQLTCQLASTIGRKYTRVLTLCLIQLMNQVQDGRLGRT